MQKTLQYADDDQISSYFHLLSEYVLFIFVYLQWLSIIPISLCAENCREQVRLTPDVLRLAIGRLCEKCELWKVRVWCVGDGKCVICDTYVRPYTLVHICDECNYGSYQGRCVVCGGPGVSDAYYCKECTVMQKDVCCWLLLLIYREMVVLCDDGHL